jgi:O-antigen ligase
VRSGLVALYLGIIYLVIRWFFIEKKYLLGLSIILLVFSLPFFAYRFIPSFNHKFSYMQYDLGQYQLGEINENSDAMRIVSMKIGMDIWKQNPLLGVGAGDLENESNKLYARDYPQISVGNRRVPHNQFVWVLASTGAIGLALFLFAFFFPLVYNSCYKHWPMAVLYLLLFSSFFAEDTLEEQIGTGFYLIFLLILMNHYQRE